MIRIKTPEQIDGIRASCKALARLFDVLIPLVKPGVQTQELDAFCQRFIRSVGGVPAWFSEGFPAAACISINEEVIHGLPSARLIQDGDLVSLDVGINLNGYISDACRTVPVGGVAHERLELLRVTTECLRAGIKACRAGARVRDVSRAVYAVAARHRFGVVYEYCGHGVGLAVHEEPNIPNVPGLEGPNPRFLPGMVVAIEPMLTLGTDEVRTSADGWTVVTADGSCACHVEHTVAVFADHTEVLTEPTEVERTG